MKDLLKAAFAAADIQADPSLAGLLARHWALVKEANTRFNLTAITEDGEAAAKHYADSLQALPLLDKYLPSGGRVCDLGTGAGFPGLVLAAARSDLGFILMDATAKKGVFLDQCADQLGLDNFSAACCRAEDGGRLPELRESFDCVTARAVAELRVLVELALPLLKVGGVLLAYKGANYQEELAAAEQALAELSGEARPPREYTLPGGEARCILPVLKTAPTVDKYPRRAGMPNKRPL